MAPEAGPWRNAMDLWVIPERAAWSPTLKVCWPYKQKGKTLKIWASGTVKRVADGLTDKRSNTAKKVLPAGAIL